MPLSRELSQLASVITVKDTTRDVGINSSTPKSKLDVGGDVNISGVVTATSFFGDGSGLTGVANTAIINSDQINVSGVSTFADDIHIKKTSGNISFYDNSGSFKGQIREIGGNFEIVANNELRVSANNDVVIRDGSWATTRAIFKDNGAVELYYPGPVTTPGIPGAGVKRFETTASGVDVTGHTETDTLNVSGVVTATSFFGDGSGLTGLSTFSGSYNDLTDKPTIPTNNNQLTNGAGYITDSSTDTLTNKTLDAPTFTGNATFDSNTLYVDSANNRIGVGTDAPAYQFEIENTGANALLVLDRTDGAACFIEGQATRSAFGSVNATPLALAYNSAAVVLVGASGSITVNPDGDGYTFPTTDGSANQVLQTDGEGNLSFATASGGIGIQSGSTRIGTGFTDFNFTGDGITIVGSGTTITVNLATSTITRQTETSSGVTTDFTITNGYTVGLIDVYLNGVKQRSGVDFTATDGSTVTMTPFISDGDVVEFQKFDVAVSSSSGGGGSSGVEIENNGTSVGTGITVINFSTNVTATASGGIATVTASGGGSDGPSSVMMGMIF